MLPINASKAKLGKFELYGKTVLLSWYRIDRKCLPDGVFAYDLREGDEGRPGTVEDCVYVNYYGTVLTTEKINLNSEGYLDIGDDDYGFLDEDVSLEEFLLEVSLLDSAKKENTMESWNEKIGQVFSLHGSEDGQKYTVMSVNEDGSINLRREDSWTLRAVNPVINGDGTIEWDYSTNGHFTDEALVAQHLQNGAKEYVSRVCEVNPKEQFNSRDK